MALLPDVQPEMDSFGESDECILRLSESEFLAMLDNLVTSMRLLTERA